MNFIIALFVAFFVILGFDQASADPITAAVTAIAGILKVGGIGAVLLKGLAYVALSLGASLLQKALTKKQSTTQDRGIELQIKMGDDIPISFPLGYYAVGGKRKYIGTWGKDGDTPNAYVTDVIELSNLPIAGLNGVWADDQKLIFETTAHPEYGFPVSQYRKSGKDYMWVKFYDGTQTTADPFLVNRFAGAPNAIGTSFIGTGCAYVIITCRFNDDLYSGLPTFTFEPGPRKVYDLRKDSTNGGVGSHRWGDYSTYEVSTNPIVNAYNIIRGVYYNNEWIFGGRNLAAFRLPASNWIGAANACDLPIVSSGGNEPSFRCGYEVNGDMTPIDVVLELMKVANARIAEVGGVFKVLVGSPGAAVFSFSDEDVIVTKEQNLDPFPNIDATLNGLEANYPEPMEKWETKDAPALYSPELEAQDGGRRLSANINLVACPYRYQVQRVMRAMLLDYRRFRIHQIYLSPEAYALEPNDVISWTSTRNGYVNKKFIIVQIESDQNFNQLLTIKEMDPSDYDWVIGDEQPVEFGWVGPLTPPPHPMYGWQVEPAVLYDSEGRPRRPSIKVSCDPEQDDVSNVHVQVRLKSTQSIVFDSDATVYEPPYEWILHGDFHANDDYEARGRFIHISDQPDGEWSSWLTVTTPNVLLTELDVYVNIDTEAIKDFIEDSTEWIRDGVRQTVLESQRTARKILDQDFGNYLNRQQLRTEVSAVNGDITARYTEAIDVAVGPNSAIASRIEEVEVKGEATATGLDALVVEINGPNGIASRLSSVETTIPNLATANALNLLSARVDTADGALAEAITAISAGTISGNTATANFRMGVSAGPAGYSSRIGMEARTGGNGAWRSAGLFIDVPASTAQPTRVAISTEQFVVTDGTATAKPLVFENGVLTLQAANIGTVNAGLLTSPDGKMVINLNAGTITISS